jgi:hypothetical protein
VAGRPAPWRTCRQASQVTRDDGTVTTTYRRSASVVLFSVSLLVGLTACDADDDADADDVADGDVTSGAPTALVTTSLTPIPTLPPDVSITAGPTFETVPETGVPGLDSDDRFCAAWSEFGGSWQVLVQSAFEGDAAAVRRLELIAAPLVTAAYDELFEAWPTGLASERDVVADAYFGAFQRRSLDALSALEAAGATGDELDRLGRAWRDGLATYDPNTGGIAVTLGDDLEALLATAAETFAAARVAFGDDPSMVITAETPLTDQYLATACPDQGWIVGQDVT